MQASLQVPDSVSKLRAHTLEVVEISQVVVGWACRHNTAHRDCSSAE